MLGFAAFQKLSPLRSYNHASPPEIQEEILIQVILINRYVCPSFFMRPGAVFPTVANDLEVKWMSTPIVQADDNITVIFSRGGKICGGERHAVSSGFLGKMMDHRKIVFAI
jgi:hypothetical protein